MSKQTIHMWTMMLSWESAVCTGLALGGKGNSKVLILQEGIGTCYLVKGASSLHESQYYRNLEPVGPEKRSVQPRTEWGTQVLVDAIGGFLMPERINGEEFEAGGEEGMGCIVMHWWKTKTSTCLHRKCLLGLFQTFMSCILNGGGAI